MCLKLLLLMCHLNNLIPTNVIMHKFSSILYNRDTKSKVLFVTQNLFYAVGDIEPFFVLPTC